MVPTGLEERLQNWGSEGQIGQSAAQSAALADLVGVIRRHWPEVDAAAIAGEVLALIANARQRAAQDAEPSIPRKPR